MTIDQLPNAVRAALRRDPRSMTEIAAAVGVHPVSVRKFAAEMMRFDADTLAKLAQVLGLSVDVTVRKKRE